MNQLKYQIFVSSTYKDLKDERDAVIKSILEIGHIPVGMEMFSAGDEEQWQLIQRTIDDCDYYLVIIGGKYGSMDGDISYTEKEYDYAKAKGIPTLGFVLDQDDNIPAKKIEKDIHKNQKLEEFKKKVQGKIVNYWKNKDELTAKVLASLTKQFAINPRVGWIRGDNQPNTQVLDELSRLSNQNETYRKELENLRIGNLDNNSTKLLKIIKDVYFEFQIFYTFPVTEAKEVRSYLDCIESIFLEGLSLTSATILKNCLCRSIKLQNGFHFNQEALEIEFKKFWTFMISQGLVTQNTALSFLADESDEDARIWVITEKCKNIFMEAQLIKFSNEVNLLPK